MALAAEHGLRVDEPVVLANGFNVMVHLEPAPVVARIAALTTTLRDPVEAWMRREVAISGYLASVGAPVVPPTDLLPPGPHQRDGLTISFWAFAERDPVRAADEVEAARMLAELHKVLKDYPGELPYLVPLDDISRGLDRIGDTGALDADDLETLRRSYDQLLHIIRDSHASTQPLHGDAEASNLIPTARGLLWTDFEDCCFGPIEWDLAAFALREETRLTGYPDAPSSEALLPYRRARKLQGLVWLLALAPDTWEVREAAERVLAAERPYVS